MLLFVAELRFQRAREVDRVRRRLHVRVADHQGLLEHRAQPVPDRQAQVAAVHHGLRPRARGRPQPPEAGGGAQRAGLRPPAHRAHVLQRAAAARVREQREAPR